MAVMIEDLAAEVVDTRGTDSADKAPASSRPPPDMERICLELRREEARRKRLWTD